MANYRNLVELLESSIQKFGPKELFGTKVAGAWQWISFEEFGRQVDAFRAGLAARGIRRGDRVACISCNRVEWAVAAHACYGLGAVFVPMYEAQVEKEWQFILHDCGAKLLLVSNAGLHERTRNWVGRVGVLEHVVVFDGPPDDRSTYQAVLAEGRRQPRPAIHPEPDEPCGFIYTSGTTGMPKGVVLTHGNILANVAGIHQVFDIGPEDRTLSFLPWSHCYGQTAELHCMMSWGVGMALAESIEKIVDNFAEIRPTVILSVPRIFNRIYDRVQKQIRERPAMIQSLVRAGLSAALKRQNGQTPTFWENTAHAIADRLVFSKVRARVGGRLKFAISGGAALSKEVGDFLQAVGIVVYEGYGLTETSPVIATNAPGRAKSGSVGKLLPGVRVEVDRNVTGDPKIGEIICYGPIVMRGYHHRPSDNEACFTKDGGFRTGDLGYVDDDGYLFITGRIKEQYKLENGKYVVPSPLEDQLKLSPYIASIMLHGMNRPHNVALVVVELAELQEWARKEGISAEGEALLRDAKVRALYRAELDKYGSEFRSYERVVDFELIAEDFTVNNGLLTPKMSVRRHAVIDRFGPQLESLYMVRKQDGVSARL